MPTIFKNPQNNNLDHSRRKHIFDAKIPKQENSSLSMESQQKSDGQPFFSRIMNFFTNFNLCLRPQVQSKQLVSFLSNYQIDSLYHDPYYGQCYALKSKQVDIQKNTLNHTHSIFNTTQQKQHFQRVASLRHYIALSKERLNKRQYKARKQILDQISSYSGSQQNVLRFTVISQLQKQQFVFTTMMMYIAYDFILIDLEKQFENRIIQKRKFTESQINIIMKESCAGLVALENTNYKSIRMSYIYFCQYGKQIKVAHPKMFKYKTNLECISYNTEQKGIYLSPQQLILLQKNQIQTSTMNNQMPSSFTFGMIILSLMCNKYLNQIYDYRTCEINIQQINQLLNNLGSIYTQRLISIIRKLLNPKATQRLTLRSLLNILEEKYQLSEHVEITLIKDHVSNQITKADNYAGYRPLFQEQPQQPRHKNYLYGMIYPKIGTQGEYYHFNDSDPFRLDQDSKGLEQNAGVVANYRYKYTGGQTQAKYIGNSVLRNQLDEKPLKEGRGIYMLSDGQSYLGEWRNNQMHGYGKLYYPGKKIRYEGQFGSGMFNGFGTQYAFEQIPEREEQIQNTFVRLQRGSWLKYQGRFKNDRRQGPGKAFFRSGMWTGNFKDDQPNGHGVWEGSDSKNLKGIWQDGCYRESV